VVPVLDEVDRLLDQLAEIDWGSVPPTVVGDAVLRLERQRSRLEAAAVGAMAAFDRSGLWTEGGFRSPRAWLAHHGRQSPAAAGRRVADARRASVLPHAMAALAAGELTTDHVAVLRRAWSPEVAADLAEVEPGLVELGRTASFEAFRRAVRYVSDAADPVRADAEASARVARREVHASRTLDGMGRLDGWLDELGFTTVRGELDRLEQQLFEQDWQAARAEHGEGATASQLPRTRAQRLADALVLMAERSASTPADARPPRPVVNVLVDWRTFCAELAAFQVEQPVEAARIRAADRAERVRGAVDGDRTCELEDGTVLLPSQALDLALRGHLRRVVFGPVGNVLEHGRTRRLFSSAQREAIIVRDRWCTVPGCEVPARRCEIDHIVPWAQGGTTDEANGRAMCDHHNRQRTRPPARPPGASVVTP
jgi:hypothetical protein